MVFEKGKTVRHEEFYFVEKKVEFIVGTGLNEEPSPKKAINWRETLFWLKKAYIESKDE